MASNDEQVFPVTKEKLEEVKEELEYLTKTRRKEVAQLIAEAKAEGDLRENAGYDEAKTQQGFVEGRILELQNVIKYAQIIEEEEAPKNAVALGRTVIIQEDGTSLKETYSIVGSLEADPADGKISNESPMGKALMGKKKGDKVDVKTPGGAITFKVVKIE